MIILVVVIGLLKLASAADEEEAASMSICGTEFFAAGSFSSILQSDYPETLRSAGQKARLFALANRTLPERPIRCSFELQTCGLCQLRIAFNPPTDLNSDRQRFFVEQKVREACEMDSVGDHVCFDLRFVEDRADTVRAESERIYRSISIWDNPTRNEYNSTSYKLKIQLTMWNIASDSQLQGYVSTLFPLRVEVFDNSEFIRGRPSDVGAVGQRSAVGFVESPRYPAAYPRGVHKNYTFLNQQEGGRVRLTFDDFQLHFQSEMKIIDTDGEELLNTRKQFNGATSRPPAIQSKGERLVLLFSGREYTQEVGFRAKYEFVASEYWPEKPDPRSCDEVLESFGGDITIASKNLQVNTYIDCIWVVRKLTYPTQTFDRLYLKVEEFNVQSNGAGIRLEIRKGLTSVSEGVMLMLGPRTIEQLAGKQPQEGFIADLNDPDASQNGFYVRLRGYLGSYSGLLISYAQFYRWATAMCPGSDEFHCDNSRCIKSQLTCDGRDHCGDYSDEKTDLCPQPSNPRTGGGLYASEGNQIKDQTPVVGGFVNIVALIAGVILLVLLMLMVTVIFARVYRQRLIRRFRREVADLAHRQSSVMREEVRVGDADPAAVMAPSIQRVGERRFYVMPETEVSIFEAPPTYDDALKHPAVPPSARSFADIPPPMMMGMQSAPRPTSSASMQNASTAFDNPTFASDSETPGPSNRQSAPTGVRERILRTPVIPTELELDDDRLSNRSESIGSRSSTASTSTASV
uniref:CUB domain-containing protein n=1 Tax=Plectus sambesii TaxID=2011161 RepID=A0A914W6N8_9BILA